MKITDKEREQINKQLLAIQNMLAEKYHGLYIDGDFENMVRDEIREMLNKYIIEVLNIEDLSYEIKIENSNRGLIFKIYL